MEEAPWIVHDDTWGRIEPLLVPRERRFRHPGRMPLDDRQVLQGILFVLYHGIGWEHLPQELGFGSGMTCWRRLRRWQIDGVWPLIQERLVAEVEGTAGIDWPRALARGMRRPPEPAPAESRPMEPQPTECEPSRS